MVTRVRRDGDLPRGAGKQGDPVVPRKASTRWCEPPVPYTDTGGPAEYAEAGG